MSDIISTKAGVFESGEKDAMGVQYKGSRLIACRNPKLTDYTVADGTEVICDRAFMNMKELRSIILPASLRAIGESSFSGCKALADITIPDGVTEIRQATFRDCDALTAIELPASVTVIEKFAFGRGLTTLVVNATEMKIDRYAFMNARDFSTLMVPAGAADYYRALLADMRVKADVEEIDEKPESPVLRLDAFIEDPKNIADEISNKISSKSKDIIMKIDLNYLKKLDVTLEASSEDGSMWTDEYVLGEKFDEQDLEEGVKIFFDDYGLEGEIDEPFDANGEFESEAEMYGELVRNIVWPMFSEEYSSLWLSISDENGVIYEREK